MPLIKNANATEMMRNASVFDLGDVRRQADETLEAAKQEAARLLSEAREQAHRMVEGATERGYAEGFEKGREEGRVEGRQAGQEEGAAAARQAMSEQLETLAASWSDALNTWNTQRMAQADEARRDLLRFAMTMTRRIVGEMPSRNEQLVLGQVAQAIDLLAERTRLRIRINPEDVSMLETHLGAILASAGVEDDATIEPDPSIDRGACVVLTPEGEVDGLFDTQLDRIISNLLPELADERTDG